MRSRRTQNKIAPAQEVILASTAAQHAEIEGLKKAIDDLTYRKLRLYATLFMLFFPNFAARIGGRILIKLYDPEFEEIEQKFCENFNKTEDQYSEFDDALKRFCKQRDIKENKCFLEVAKMYDEAVRNDASYALKSGGHLLASDIRENFAPVKKQLETLVERYTHINALSTNGELSILPDSIIKLINTSIAKNKILSTEDLYKIKKSLSAIIRKDTFPTLIKKLIELRSQALAKGKSFFLHYVSDIMATGIKREIFLLLGVSIGIQRGVVEPLFFRLHRRFFNKTTPFVNQRIINQDQAKQLIQSLKTRRDELKTAAENNTWYARRLLILIAIALIPLGTLFSLPAVEIGIFIFSFLTVALYNSYEDTMAWKKQRQFNSTFDETEKNLNSLVSGWKPHKKTTLEESFFVWEASKQDKMPAFVFCRLVKNILVKHALGNAITSYSQTKIAVSANISLSLKKAKELQAEITQSLKRYHELKTLFAQLSSLSKHIAPYYITRSHLLGRQGVKLKLPIPNHFLSVLTEENLQELFPQSKISIEAQTLSLFVYESANVSQLDKFIQDIIQCKNKNLENKEIASPPLSTKEIFQRIPKGYAAVTEIKSESKEPERKTETTPKKICWKSGTFSNDQKDNKIVPYRGKNQFLLCKLTQEDFPDEKTYHKLFGKVERQKRAAGFTNEGWRHYGSSSQPHEEQDSQGNWFKATFDIKTLGAGGSGTIRLYGDTEKDESGKNTLYVVKGINRAH